MIEHSPVSWLTVISRYLLFSAVANLLWEIAHVPLYTIWNEESLNSIIFAVVHCTGGDVLITTAVLVMALVVSRCSEWPHVGYLQVAVLTILFGFTYTIYSEWLNTEIRQSWAYTELMPTLPILGTGLSPLAQWIVIPVSAFLWAGRPAFLHPQLKKENTT